MIDTYTAALEAHAAAVARAAHAAARARESGSRQDWRAYTIALEDLAHALTVLDRARPRKETTE
jgi:hypothetical protein